METTFQVNEVKLSLKRAFSINQKQIKSASDARKVLLLTEELKNCIDYKEYFFVIYLDRAGNVLSYQKVSEGGLSSTVVDIRFIMQGAILQNASGVITAHNHPSGNTIPSHEDIQISKKIGSACDFFNLSFVDNLIITRDNYYSFSEEGII